MAFLERNANRGSISTGYDIDYSLKLEADNSEYLKSASISTTPSSTSIGTYSCWIKRTEVGRTGNYLFVASNSARYSRLFFNSTDQIQLYSGDGSWNSVQPITNATYRDTSAWYHLVLRIDATDGTAANRLRLYMNGVEQTWATAPNISQNSGMTLTEAFGSPGYHGWGVNLAYYTASAFFSGYLADVYYIDGQALAPTEFGEFDSDSGIWKPIEYTGTYGNCGYYMDFADSGDLGDNESSTGSTFDFSENNITAVDQATDTPTNNFCTLNAAISVGNQYGRYVTRAKHGATQPDEPTGSFGGNWGTHSFSKGKWYWEIKQYLPNSLNLQDFGVASCKNCSGPENQSSGFHISEPTKGLYSDASTGIYPQAGSTSSYIGNTASSANDNLGPAVNGAIFQIAFDADDGKIWFGKNDTWQDTVGGTQPSKSDIAAGNNARYTSINSNAEGPWMPTFGMYNANQGHHMDINFGGYTVATPSSGNTDGNGYGNFEYEPPSGFLAICSKNLAEEGITTIDDPSAHFQVALHTSANGVTVTNDGNSNLQPDFLWSKARAATHSHGLFDSSRGVRQWLRADTNDSEVTVASGYDLTAFSTDGFTTGNNQYNSICGGTDYVAWQWKANGGTVSNNTDGDLTTSVQVNATAGFSIATYTPPNDTARTVGHGIGAAPEFIIIRARNRVENWHAYHSASGTGGSKLDDDTAHNNNSVLGDALATSSVYKLGTDWRMNGSYNYVMYSWAPIEGYSIFGKYQGNGYFGTAGAYPEGKDGPFIHTGFKPALIIIKCDSTTGSWAMYDHKRDGYNKSNDALFVDTNTAEASNNISGSNIGIYSNGFKIHNNDNTLNASGEIYTYAAWAAQPQQTSTGIPCTAR